MSPPVLLALVAAGILLIGLVLHLTGHSRVFDIDTESVARREWTRHNSNDRVVAALVAANHRAALIETAAGPGVLWSFGADTCAQHLVSARVIETDEGLTIVTGDFAAPSIRLCLAPYERSVWLARITGAASV